MRFAILIASGLVLALAAGCASTQTARSVEKSGFLSPYYGKLEKTSGDPHLPLMLYRNPNRPLADFDKLMLDPVTIWSDDATKGLNAADRQRLANNAYKILWSRLSTQTDIVDEPGPGVARLSFAITRADQSNVTLDTVSSVVPQMRAMTTLTGYATGKPAFTGQAAAEWKLVDTQTGELLIAGADRRVGNKSISGSTDSWSDVHDALEYWADRGAYNLCRWRGVRSDCKPPQDKSGI